MYGRILIILTFFALLLALAPASSMAAGILVPNPTPFSKESNVRKKILDECQLETKLPSFVICR